MKFGINKIKRSPDGGDGSGNPTGEDFIGDPQGGQGGNQGGDFAPHKFADLTEALGLFGSKDAPLSENLVLDPAKAAGVLEAVTARLQKQGNENKGLRTRALAGEAISEAVTSALGLDATADLATIKGKLAALKDGAPAGDDDALAAATARISALESMLSSRDQADKEKGLVSEIQSALRGGDQKVLEKEATDYAHLLKNEFERVDGKLVHKESGKTVSEWAASWKAERPYLVEASQNPGGGGQPPATHGRSGSGDKWADASSDDLLDAAIGNPKK